MVHALHALSLQYLDNPSFFQHRMAYCAERIFAKCGVVQCVWAGFIDGTLQKTCRPSFFQTKLLYSGHKRAHGIKFQSVVAPDGHLATCMFGPITGNRRHDSYMLAKSRLIAKLHEMMPPLPAAPIIDGGNEHENLQKLASFHYMGIQLVIPNLFSFLEDAGILAQQGLKKRGGIQTCQRFARSLSGRLQT